MNRQEINLKEFTLKPTALWSGRWLLLTAGDFEKGEYNSMTVAWGSLGTMWHKPFAQVVVRPQRYTFEFMEKYPDFTLSVLPADQIKTMQLMGSKSGRDEDKIALAGLTPMVSQTVGAPAFEEAELIMECRKIYRDVIKKDSFLDPDLDSNYAQGDYHTIYFGEILKVMGTDSYKS